MSPLTLVSAAVLMRGEAPGGGPAEFLLARRPVGKVYAGWWEFPGGKVEAGETFHDALLRELHEELGIRITAATPWLTREFCYPHATVRIRFFRVSAWEGETRPLEHDAIAWQPAHAPAQVEPILPANGPILKGLALPTHYAITAAEDNGIDTELARLERAFAAGLRLVQVRDKRLPAAQRERFAQAVAGTARAHGALVLINDDAALARRVGADGLHLPATALAACSSRPEFAWVGASCHDAAELAQAAALGLDYALLGPVLPTPTHAGQAALGWDEFARRVEECPLPVFALGGMTPAQAAQAAACGGQGVASIRGWG